MLRLRRYDVADAALMPYYVARRATALRAAAFAVIRLRAMLLPCCFR